MGKLLHFVLYLLLAIIIGNKNCTLRSNIHILLHLPQFAIYSHQFGNNEHERTLLFLLKTFLLKLCMSEPQQPRLLDRVRNTLRLKHMSIKTEKSYIYFIKQFYSVSPQTSSSAKWELRKSGIIY